MGLVLEDEKKYTIYVSGSTVESVFQWLSSMADEAEYALKQDMYNPEYKALKKKELERMKKEIQELGIAALTY